MNAAAPANRHTPPPWTIVCGGFHRDGGMDRANGELARYLAESGAQVHLAAYRVDEEFAALPNVHVYLAERPAGSFFLARRRLARLGREVASRVLAENPAARVAVNGTNCAWRDINWIHYVHGAWRGGAAGPRWFRIKNRISRARDVSLERRLLPRARILIANSERTRRDLIECRGVAPERVRTVYLGCGPEWRAVTAERRAAARAALQAPIDGDLVAFVGAFGHDQRKGFDTLWAAWRELARDPSWNATLIAAGGGRGLERWRATVAQSGLADRVRILGFTREVPEVIAAADLLVSPVRYESYGLNVHEALCAGVPAIVSRAAGVAERYPAELEDLLLPDPDDSEDLAARLLRWRSRREILTRQAAALGARLRAYTWRDMAAAFVTAVTTAPAGAIGSESAIRFDRASTQ
jgi:glycosyltransferase involved in cell wall biosynthesis